MTPFIYSVTASGVGHFIAVTGRQTVCGESAAYEPSFIASGDSSLVYALRNAACPACVAAIGEQRVADEEARLRAAVVPDDEEEVWA